MTLADKKIPQTFIITDGDVRNDRVEVRGYYYEEKDVKNFVDELKKALCEEYYERGEFQGLDRISQQEILKKIDKIMGDL